MDIHCEHLRDRRVAALDPERRPMRRTGTIRAIILHQTQGGSFLPSSPHPYPAQRTDARVGPNHRIDDIAAHFVVIADGTIFYTHDVESLSRSAGWQTGIDIEFAGRFSLSNPLGTAAIRSGRALIGALKTAIPSIGFIHPHGQIQHKLMSGQTCGGTTGVRCGKLDSCPGPDVWINVGLWAARRWQLTFETPLPVYQNNGISAAQLDRRFDQEVP